MCTQKKGPTVGGGDYSTAAARSGARRVHELSRVNLPTPAENSELEAKRRPRFTPIVETVSRYPYSSASRLTTLGQEVLFLVRWSGFPSVDGSSAEAQTSSQETTAIANSLADRAVRLKSASFQN